MKVEFKIVMLLVAIIFLLPLFSSCNNKVSYISDTFVSMDTIIEIKIAADAANSASVFEKCRAIIEEYRFIFDANDEKSELSIFNAKENGSLVSDKFAELILLANAVSSSTDGAFDVTLRPIIELWITADEEERLPSEILMDEMMPKVSFETLNYDENTHFLLKNAGQKIDVGGIAKGAAAEAVVDYLAETGVRYGVLSFGGNIALFGQRPDGKNFRIALRDPISAGSTVGNLSLDGGFVSVSGSYERYYEIGGEKYHHILDPNTGYPSDSGLLSVAVISDDGALADALSTALFVIGTDSALELYRSEIFDFEAVFITNGEIRLTEGLEDRFELTNDDYMIVK